MRNQTVNESQAHHQRQEDSDTSRANPHSVNDISGDQAVYVTAAILASRLSISRQTVYNLMGSVLKEGVHYFRGLNGRPLFKWETIVALVESPCPSDHTKGISSSISAIRIPAAENTVRFPTLPKIGNASGS
jgi:hypothetical protein